jgi:NADH-quinone oxidoreductase subunit E
VNSLAKKYPEEIARFLAQYPADQKRAAILPLLHLAQREDGFITLAAMKDVADLAEVTVTDVASIVGFYTLFHDHPEGKIRLQVCTDVACMLRGAEDYLKALCQGLGIQPGETTADGMVTLEEVKCVAACDRAPMFQSQIGEVIEYHENQTPEKTLDWLRSMSASVKGGE